MSAPMSRVLTPHEVAQAYGLNSVSIERTCKTFRLALDALYDRHSHVLFRELCIDLEHLLRTILCLFASGVSRVTFLPEELAGAEEKACAHLPSHDVTPLVDQQGQVAIGLYPVLEGVPDDSLRRWADDEFLLKLGGRINHYAVVRLVSLEAVVRDDCTLLCKAFHMLCLFREETLRDEQGEVGVLHASLFEHVVECVLHLLPDCIAVRLDDHAAAHVALLREVCLNHQFVVPFAVVLAAFCEEIQFFCHCFMMFVVLPYIS